MISNNERAVLQALWDADRPLSRPEILDKITKNNWNPNSIHSVLNNLIRKGFVEVDGVTRCGQSYGRTYRPAKTQGEYVADLALQALPDTSEEECILTLMSAMVNRKNVSAETIALLGRMVDDRRQELQREKEQMPKDEK